MNNQIISWLMEGDPSIQYQVCRDLFEEDNKRLQRAITKSGWGAKYLSYQNENGHWGLGYYQPKWTSTHYTLLDLKNFCILPTTRKIKKIIKSVLLNEMNHGYTKKHEMIVNKDICINGMVLNYASYFKSSEKQLIPIVEYIIKNQMSDGGFNCHSTRKGAKHSSLHTTLSVLEGIYEFKKNGYEYKIDELTKIENESIEFILQHNLYKSDKTGEVINNAFTRLSYPTRWKYDILRCLDYLQFANFQYDDRMQDAIDLLISKRKPNGLWPLQSKHPGQVHFDMEKGGQPSRWNTLRALRVLKHFSID